MRYVRVAAGVLSCLVVLMSASACGKEKEEVLEPQQTAAVTEAALTSETEETTEPEETEETTDSEETTEEESTESSETENTSETSTAETDAEQSDTTESGTGVTMFPIDGQPVTTLPAENNTPEQPIETIPAVPAQPVGDEVTFQFNGNALRVGDNASGFTSAVPAKSQESAPSCYGNGENINYYYDDFTIFVWNENGNYMVYSIDIGGAGVATQEGITIGSTVDDLIAAYGGEYQEEGMDYVYTYGDDCSLRFTVDNNEVLYISYNMDLEQ